MTWGGASDFDVRVYSDNGGTWGTEIGSFGIQSGPGGGDISTYEFFPAALIPLLPNTVYWIVATVSNEADICAVGWNSNGSTPSGILSFVDAIQIYNGNSNQRDSGQTLEINGSVLDSVPVPGLGNWGMLLAVLLLAATGSVLLRRQKKTINLS